MVLSVACLLVGFVGCSRKVSTSAGDQSMAAPKPQAAAPAERSVPVEAAPSLALQEKPAETAPSLALQEKPVETASSGPVEIREPIQAAPATPAAPLPPPATPAPAISDALKAALADVYFDYDRFAIRNEAQKILEANARVLKSKNGWKLLVEGHCDERGTADYNLVLGERRAQSVKRYLQNLGVSASQVQITSFGKERPFCADHSDACWQQNRRAHFVIQ
jgi:peptidoglycan-associated lipoprotein